MTTHRSRPAALVLAALLLTIVSTVLRTETTDAAWQGRDHAAATVTSGSWPSAGSAYAEVGRVASASGVTFDLLRGGTNPPWPGPSSARSQAVPGTATGTTAGPYSSAGVLGLANELTSRGAVAGTPITGAACAAYGWAPATPAPCVTVPSQRVNASATLSSYTLYASLLSLLGLGSTDVVAVPSPVTSSVSCDLASSGPTYTAAAPSAANVTASNPRGSISVRGGSAVAVPPAGGTTSFDFPQSGSTVVVPGVSGTLRSVIGTTTSARSSLVLENGRILRLGVLGNILLDIRFTLVLVDAACGSGATGPVATTAAVAARVAGPEQSTTTTAPTTEPATTTAPTTEPATTTAPTTSITTTSAAATTTFEATTTKTTTPPVTSTTTPPVTSTTTPPAVTSFSGSGAVTAITTSGGTRCTVGSDAVTFACSDGSVLTFDPDALTAAGVAANTMNGLWTPATTAGDVVTVASAVRG